MDLFQFDAQGPCGERIEAAQRLVVQCAPRFDDDGATHGHPPTLAAGERSRQTVQQFLQAQHRRGGPDPAPDLVALDAARDGPERQVAPDRQVWVQRVFLEDHGDVAIARRHSGGRSPVEPDRSAGDLFEAGDEPQQRRLAAAGRTQHGDDLGVSDVQIEVAERNGTARKHLADSFQEQVRHAQCGSAELRGTGPSCRAARESR